MSRLRAVAPAVRGRFQRGQILPLFALMIVVIFGFVALAVDVSNVYATRRAMRSAADAAALAGAQDLQGPSSRTVREADYVRGRNHAIKSLEDRLGLTAATCAPYVCLRSGATTVYRARIVAPLSSVNSCEGCDPKRSLSVTLERPAFPLTFARILGFSTFDIGVASVATIGYARNYTVVTLRPPQNGKTDENRDLFIAGGSILQVRNGDVASNANMVYNGSGSRLLLDEGFDLDYFDKFNVGQQWDGAPTGTKVADPVLDPRYWEKLGNPRTSTASTTYTGADAPCDAAVTKIRESPTGNYARVNVPNAPTQITCYSAGVHADEVKVANGDLVILLPGVHFFDGGLVVKGTLIGGYEPAKPGVTLVFKEARDQFVLVTASLTGQKEFAEAVVLNAGSRSLTGAADGTAATAAELGDRKMQTDDVLDPKPLTLVVVPTGLCEVRVPVGGQCLRYEDSHAALNISGNAALYLGGVQYAPEDNVSISGNSGSQGYVGQLWAWTVKYSGGIRVLQEGAESMGPGLLRLDAACTTSKTKCGN